MLRPLILCLCLVQQFVPIFGSGGGGATAPNWIQGTYYSDNYNNIINLEEFLACIGWKKEDFNGFNGNGHMVLNFLNRNGKPGIELSTWGNKKHTVAEFELGREFLDTMISGKKAKTTIDIPKRSGKRVLVEITHKLEDGRVKHQLEIDTGVKKNNADDEHPIIAVRTQSVCYNNRDKIQVNMPSNWYPSP